MNLTTSQRDLISKLSDPDCPRLAAVQAEVGAGVSRPIEYLIEQFARTDSILLVVPNFRLIADQWRFRLSEARDILSVHQLSLALALDMLDKGVPKSGSVVVATPAILRHSNVQRLVDTWSGVLIVFEPSGTTLSRLANAMSTAQRTIVVLMTPDQPAGNIPIVARLVRGERPTFDVTSYEFEVPSDEIVLMNNAVLLIEQYRRIRDWPASLDLLESSSTRGPAPIYTRPLLMDSLLRIATAEPVMGDAAQARSEAAEVAETAWTYIDQLEHLTTDPRLVALDRAIDGCDRDRMFIVVPTLVEVDYVAQHLESTRGDVKKLISTNDATRELEEVLGANSGPKLIAGTAARLRAALSFSGITWPDSLAVIIWSSERLLLEQIADAIQNPGQNTNIAVLRQTP